MAITYADTIGHYTLHRSPVKKRYLYGGNIVCNPGQAETGYGSKITTDIVLKFAGENCKRRVYATCYSNAASHWILYNGEKVHLGYHDQSDIMDD